MAERFSYRSYGPGDEVAINELYFAITGRQRTLAQFAWQWLDAPEGQGDMWLIEETDRDGRSKLIGHHGVMPIAFSNGSGDLVFGKTENTMVLPEYRSKILYPRYEKKFIKEYRARYRALFSTLGPPAAIRLRKAMGYEFPVRWSSMKYRIKPCGEILFLLEMVRKQFSRSYNQLKNPIRIADREVCLREVGFLNPIESSSLPFFKSYWQLARRNYGISPRREHRDLDWRFWKNPYKRYFSFVFEEDGGTGYCIFSLNDDNGFSVLLEDFNVKSNTDDERKLVFNAFTTLLRKAGIYWIDVNQTSDSALFASNSIDSTVQLKSWNIIKLLGLAGNDNVGMPRKIVKEHSNDFLGTVKWDITGIVFEGTR
ncbi:hypothetical protein OAE20_03095 [Porticoccaceae bacterium]|nr:hypothetical protein [Porticoccaceae bacterium]